MLASLLKDIEKVAIFEKNSKLGEKLKISGGGKCNISNRNVSEKRYLGDTSFISNILDDFSIDEIYNICKKHNFKPKLDERLVSGSLFCHSSKDILEVFYREIDTKSMFLNCEIYDVEKIENGYLIKTERGYFKSEKVVIASGGLSYPSVGVSDIAYKIGEKFGHEIIKPLPALVGLTVQKDQFWFKNLSGLSLNCKAKIGEREISGDLLFTHKGFSGPLVFNISLYWSSGKISLDFLPEYKLENFLKRGSNKLISTAIPLPKNFIREFLKSIDLEDKAISKLSNDEVLKLSLLKNYIFAPAGNFGLSKAEITKGGVSTLEIDENSMMSKKSENLFFIGENLDVSGELGGFNIHFAFASAKRCANFLRRNLG
jgi:hypothetical protein